MSAEAVDRKFLDASEATLGNRAQQVLASLRGYRQLGSVRDLEV